MAALLFPPAAALAFTPQGAPQHPAANAGLPGVTIEAARALRRQVHHFVTAVVAPPPLHRSLLRWNTPICPLVVGLPRDWGNLILAHISQAARDAHAPLAGTKCRPNLFVVVSAHPDSVLRQWMARDPKVDTRYGLAPLQAFLKSTLPVREWYNPQPSCAGGVPSPSSTAAASAIGMPYDSKHVAAAPAGGMGPTYCDNSIDTHLTYGDVRSLSYAIVVVDTNQLSQKHVNLGQLADYVSLVGLVDVQPGTDGGGAPTILRLFDAPNPPDGLTPWDRALIYSLYNTSQSSRIQLIDMEVSMTRRIAP
ncbi:MAG: hypothetical protein ACREUL_14730 [Steroidobacteraceae bacterium]